MRRHHGAWDGLEMLMSKLPPCLTHALFAGDDPYARSEEQSVADYDSRKELPQLVFLGLDEKRKAGFEWHAYHGTPTFALDTTPKGSISAATEDFNKSLEARGLKFVQGRMNTSLPASDAAIYAQARALLDWNARNPFCGQCGQRTCE